MLHIGCHLSSSAGYYAMGQTAQELGADTLQFFTRNPRGSKAKAIDPQDAAAFCTLLKQEHFPSILAHAPYTLNPCSSNPHTRQFAQQVLADDLTRMEYTPGQYYNFHPGSHTGQGVDKGSELIRSLLNSLLTPEQTTTVLLETMAGKGTEIGRSFEELADIINGIQLQDKIGVCLDTCHIADAGYDIIHDLDGVLNEFDHLIGLERLKYIHLNDSQNPLGSHKDRHACIGRGTLGLATFRKIVTHPQLCHLPFILETPNDLPGYKEEIALVRSFA